MKFKFILSAVLLAGVSLSFNACKDDEVKTSGVRFEVAEQEVLESDGTIESFHPLRVQGGKGREIKIRLVLDRPAAATSVISFETSGSAVRNSASAVGDYSIDGNNLTIEQGANEAFINVTLFEDFDFEYDPGQLNPNGVPYNTIRITLKSVVSGPMVISQDENVHTVKILEDDNAVLLAWGANGGTVGQQRGDVKMDMLLWLDNDYIDGDLFDDASPGAVLGFNIPAGYPSASYGLSYTYLEGTSDNVTFDVIFFNTAGTLNANSYPYPERSLRFANNKYTSAHVNFWRNQNNANHKGLPQIIQTFAKNGINFTNISGVTPKTNGSRLDLSTSTPIEDIKGLKGLQQRGSKKTVVQYYKDVLNRKR